jgi:putative hemolysin
MDYTLVSGVLASLVFAIFFSGIEVAFLSANKLQIELQDRQGNISGRIMTFFLLRPTWFIGTTLVGNLASLILFGIFTTQLIVTGVFHLFSIHASVIFIFALIIALALTALILYTVEFLSKSLFVIKSNKMLTALAIPFVVICIVVFPVVYFIISLAKFVSVYILKLEYSAEKPVFGLTDVNQYLKSMYHIKDDEKNIELDKKIFNNALEFKTVRIRDCMIPRTEIVAVGIDAGIKKLHEAFVESGHSKIIIYRESIDDVIGYCHSSALFKKPQRIENILTPIITIPETTLANELMIRFINERKSLAAVIDEFGGTSGIVSMEDVIEEIFGEIEDEHDEDDLAEQKLDDNTYLLSARLEIDYLNDKYHWQLPVGDYETLSGLILSFTEDIPNVGDTINIPPYTFVIQTTQENRMNSVKMTINDPETD